MGALRSFYGWLFVCVFTFSLAASAKPQIREGFVDIMPAATAATFKALLPRVDSSELDQLLQSPDTMWYDEHSIVPGYQDSMGDPRGFRPNTIQSILIDLAVPGGHRRLFSKRGKFNFPFATGGADLSDNMVKVNFWSVPRQNGKVLPVAYWKLNFSRWRWLFPVGTQIGEVLLVKFPDEDLRVFEIRVRKREISKWTNIVYRPFPTADDLLDGIKRHRPNWYQIPALTTAIQHLANPETLTSRTLATQYFPGTFTSVTGSQDVIPDLGDASLVKTLLRDSLFRAMDSYVWKSSNGKTAFAASSRSNASIVPNQYDGGMLPLTDDSCLRCHRDAGRQISEFHPDLILYGELWGEDETFSWHPFDNAMFVAANGDVNNFNDDNRRIRSDFAQAGLVQLYSTAIHPSHLYKELARDWKYKPAR